MRDASGRDRDPSVAGSSGPENSYILDGINTTDPAFGGGGANLPFEFVQEVQIKTGRFGADQGLSTGGVFNVITKTGGNEFHGDLFAYGLPKSFVRDDQELPAYGLRPRMAIRRLDAGGDIGGPIIKNRLTFFAAFNPQYRTNNYLDADVPSRGTGQDQDAVLFGQDLMVDQQQQHMQPSRPLVISPRKQASCSAVPVLALDPNSFPGTRETGGHNYSARLNSNIRQNWIGEFYVRYALSANK